MGYRHLRSNQVKWSQIAYAKLFRLTFHLASGNKGKRLWSDPKSIGITGFFSFANWKKRQKWPSDTKLIPLPLRHRIMSKHPKALKFVFLWTNLRAFFTVFSVVPQFPQTKKFSKISLIPLILTPLKFRISEGTFPYTNSGGFKYGWKLFCSCVCCVNPGICESLYPQGKEEGCPVHRQPRCRYLFRKLSGLQL